MLREKCRVELVVNRVRLDKQVEGLDTGGEGWLWRRTRQCASRLVVIVVVLRHGSRRLGRLGHGGQHAETGRHRMVVGRQRRAVVIVGVVIV